MLVSNGINNNIIQPIMNFTQSVQLSAQSAVNQIQKNCMHAVNQAQEQSRSGIQSFNEFKSNAATQITLFASDTKERIFIEAGAVKRVIDLTIQKIKQFLIDYSFAFAVTGASAVTLQLSPHLFLTGAAFAFIGRVELKNLTNLLEKGQNNPFNIDKFGPQYLDISNVVLASVAAIDAVAKSAFFVPFASVSLMPFIGGMVAGNCLAKMRMDSNS